MRHNLITLLWRCVASYPPLSLQLRPTKMAAGFYSEMNNCRIRRQKAMHGFHIKPLQVQFFRLTFICNRYADTVTP